MYVWKLIQIPNHEVITKHSDGLLGDGGVWISNAPLYILITISVQPTKIVGKVMPAIIQNIIFPFLT